MDMLPKCPANYTPLTPTTFLKRAALCYALSHLSHYNNVQFTWSQTYDRCRRLAYSLRALNIAKNDVVSVLAPNVPAMYEMHFAVPMAGAVLNTINTRLDAKNIATILRHSEAKAFFVDYQYLPQAVEALKVLMLIEGSPQIPLVVVIDDIAQPTGARLGALEYEELVLNGNPEFDPVEVTDEWDSIALNYTSGTTSAPKGVVYSHRGAFLSTMSLVLQWQMKSEAVYLWSLPMFHCNGWTFTWGVAARGGTNVCIRNTCAADMYHAIVQHKVTHMCCAPIVFNILLDAKPNERRDLVAPVEILTGGAPPPAALLEKIEALGFHVTHAYGLTEATGPALVCEWQAKWDNLPNESRAVLKSRQGISVLTLADVDVKDLNSMASVPRDGRTIGEIVLRGSSIMKGYYKDPEATAKAFRMVGGENISSVEVESVLYKHPRVLEAAVVAMPHPFYGEAPCAFVSLRKSLSESEREVVFSEDLPKNANGKIEKFKLRELAKKNSTSSGSDSTPSQSSPAAKSQRAPMNRGHRKHPQEPLHQEHVIAMSRL
ncbi:hypothetical protein Syun_022458 [Stephania yunnanensis]|uniref:4-coumarate--CoA ligase n=1 Tax=Stephania yunnanensis TaxID=152371 RepID=A0AAP0F9N2_9MAGN